MAMTTIVGVVGLESVCDTPAGIRKGALVVACTKTQMFILRKRISSREMLRAGADKYRKEMKIQRGQWLEVEMATYVITHRFVDKATSLEVPGTGPTFADLGKDEFAKLTLSDDIRLGCAPMKGGYALMPTPVVPESMDDDIPAVETADVAE